MAKQQRRKPPKRTPGRPKIDDDLAQLASVLAEREYTENPEGWFSIPWRDGWNAARLCYLCSVAQAGTSLPSAGLIELINLRSVTSFAYERAENHRSGCIGLAEQLHGRWAAHYKMLVAGFRCVQLTIANSSGGGEVFNDVLKLAFGSLHDNKTDGFHGEVREARCLDAIGVTPDLENNKHDRLRRAFKIAWDRGLYQAAYALPRAT